MKIAVIVDSFPKLSITFIINQVTGLLDLGHEVDIFASSPGDDPKIHPDVFKYNLLSRIRYRKIPKNKPWRILIVILGLTGNWV